MCCVGSILPRLFFRVIWKYGILEGIPDVHCMCFGWIHYVTWPIWTESKVIALHFERKVESEVEWSNKLQFFF